MSDMNKFIKIITEGVLKEARRATAEEFIEMAKQQLGDTASHATMIDLMAVAKNNDVQLPMTVRNDPRLRSGPHHWNLTGEETGSGDIAKKFKADTGQTLDSDSDGISDEYKSDLALLKQADIVQRLASNNKIFLTGRKANGAFFKIPNLEQIAAQISRMMARSLESKGDSTMAEQYELLREKVELVAGGRTANMKALLITGAPSSGKSYTVMEEIKKLGVPFLLKKGRITVPQLFRSFIENVESLMIFDDCDSVGEDKNGKNMLKGALDTDPIREISNDIAGSINVSYLSDDELNSYCASLSRAFQFRQTEEDIDLFKATLTKMGLMSKALAKVKKRKATPSDELGDDDEDEYTDDELSEIDNAVLSFVRDRLPSKVSYKGRIIFISNKPAIEWDDAILTRCMHQDMKFRDDEMLSFIYEIKDKLSSSITPEEKVEVLDFLKDQWTTGKLRSPINFRLVLSCFDYRLSPNWRKNIASL